MGALVALGTVPKNVGAQLPPDPKPNILIFVTDDQRRDTMSAMPATRAIFGEGTRFTNGAVTTPLCCPSRASILTGRYAHNHGLLGNGGTLETQDETIQRYLDDAGYRTGIIGKYLNSWRTADNPPHFDEWALTRKRYYNYKADIDGEVTERSDYHTDFVEEQTTLFLDESEAADSEPWYLYVSTYAPHGPSTPEPEHEAYQPKPWDGNPAVFEEQRNDKPPWVQERSQRLWRMKRIRRKQLRSLRSVDEMIGRTFERLEALDEETLAIFISDNGLFWGEHGLYAKSHPYRAALEVPFFVRWPGHVPAGRSGALAANIDIAPTVLDAADIEAAAMDGRSLLEPLDRNRLLHEHWRVVPQWAATRNSRIHYTEYYDDEGSIMFRELYRLRNDPWQLRNVLGDATTSNDPPPDNLERLSVRLAADRTCAGDSCP